MDCVAVLHDTDDRTGRMRGIFDIHHHLVQVRVEALAKRFDPPNAEVFKSLHEETQRRLNTFDERRVLRSRWRLVAGGCNLVVFTTGRGSCLGFKPSPVLKIATNTP